MAEVAVMSLGSVMVMLMMLHGELPGRSGGEKVVRCEISHGSRENVAPAEGARASAAAVIMLRCISCDCGFS